MPGAWKTIRVFISSTFRDMQAERDHLVRFVFPRLREELLKWRIHLVDVDLRWGVTSEQDAVEVCQEIIDECRPRFLCILGGRYGWTPPGREESITAQEIRYAVLHRLDIKEYRFFYFRNPRMTAAIPESAARAGGYREFPPPEEVEEYGRDQAEMRARRRAEKLEALKEEVIKAGYEPFIYPARWDRAQQRLADLKAFGDRVYADLLWSINDEFGEAVPVELDEFASENAAMEAFIQERVERYVVGSRHGLLEELTAFAEGKGPPNVLGVTGSPGSGKSALLARFYLDYFGPEHKTGHFQDLVIPHFIGASPGSTDLRRTLRRFCHELAQAVGLQVEISQDLQELLQKFPDLLKQAAASRRVVLLLDALNQLDAADNAHAMYWLPYDLPPHVRVIVSSLEHPALHALHRRGKERVREAKLESLGSEDRLAILTGFLNRYRKRMTEEQITALLGKEESGNPLYLLTALEELRTLGTYEEITKRIEELPGQVPKLFQWIFERLESDPDFQDPKGRPLGLELVSGFASLLGVSRYGLSQMELAELLAPGDPQAEPPIIPDPQGNVAALLRLLRPYLMQRGKMLDFYHSQVKEAVEGKYLKGEERLFASHRRLSGFFHAKADPYQDNSWIGGHPRGLSLLPYHLFCAQKWSRLCQVLTDVRFLEINFRARISQDLLANYQLTLAEGSKLPLSLRTIVEEFGQFVFHQRHFLERYPHLVCQEGSNQNYWQSVKSKAKESFESGKETRPWLCLRWSLELASRSKATLEAHSAAVSACAFSPANDLIVTGETDIEDFREEFTASDSYSDPWKVCDSKIKLHLFPWVSYQELETDTCKGGVSSLDFSRDGQYLAVGVWDGKVRYFDSCSFACLKEYKVSEEGISCCRFSPNGRFLACCSRDISRYSKNKLDVTLKVIDLQEQEIITFYLSDIGGLYSCDWSSDGKLIAAGHENGNVSIFDFSTRKELYCFKALKSGPVYSCRFNPLNNSLVVGGHDYSLCIWNISDPDKKQFLKEHNNTILSVAISPNGRIIASGSLDQTIKLWDGISQKCLVTIHGHSGMVLSLCFSADNKYLCSGGEDKRTRIWEIETILQATGQEHDLGLMDHADLSPDADELVVAFSSGVINRYGVDLGKKLISSIASTDRKILIKYLDNNKNIIFGTKSQDQGRKSYPLIVWQENNQVLIPINNSQPPIPDFEMALWKVTYDWIRCHTVPDRDLAFLISATRIGIFSMKDFAINDIFEYRTIMHPYTKTYAASPDGKFILMGDDEGNLWEFDLSLRRHLDKIGRFVSYVNDASYSFDGESIALCTGTKERKRSQYGTGDWQEYRTEVHLINKSTKQIDLLRGHSPTSDVVACKFLGDGCHLATGTSNGELFVWNLNKMTPVFVTFIEGGINKIAAVQNCILTFNRYKLMIHILHSEITKNKQRWWQFWKYLL
jgi:telomerase protein component 1